MNRNPAKKWIVEKVVLHGLGVVVPLRICPDKGDFWFVWPDDSGLYPHLGVSATHPQQYSHPDRSGARSMIEGIVISTAQAEWEKVILIRTAPDYNRGTGTPAQVGFRRLHRCERAQFTYRKPVRCAGTNARAVESVLAAAAATEDTYGYKTETVTIYRAWAKSDGETHSYGDTVIPYTPEAWAALGKLREAYKVMHEQLGALLNGETAEVSARLAAFSTPLSLTTREDS